MTRDLIWAAWLIQSISLSFEQRNSEVGAYLCATADSVNIYPEYLFSCDFHLY